MLGLIAGRLKLMDWPSVTGWVSEGGAKLGTKRTPPQEDQLPAIAQKLKEFGIQALLIIGGFEVTRIVPNVAPFSSILDQEISIDKAYIFLIFRVIKPVLHFSKRGINMRSLEFLSL